MNQEKYDKIRSELVGRIILIKFRNKKSDESIETISFFGKVASVDSAGLRFYTEWGISFILTREQIVKIKIIDDNAIVKLLNTLGIIDGKLSGALRRLTK